MLTSQEFQQCFLYLGAGKDIEPLFRYSHLCSDFVYCDLPAEKESIIDYYQSAIKQSAHLRLIRCEVLDDFNEERFFELDPDYISYMQGRRFMSKRDFEEYSAQLAPLIPKAPWALILEIERTRPSRKLRLIYFTTEGLAAYVALSKNGTIAPKVLCTIQTGGLEFPNSFMDNVFSTATAFPSEWIRGFEPGKTTKYNPVFSKSGKYSIPFRNFNFSWQVGDYAAHMSGPFRYCRSFTCQKPDRLPRQRADRTSNGVLYSTLKKIRKQKNDGDALIITRQLANRYAVLPKNTFVWEKLVPRESGAKVSLPEAFGALEDLRIRHPFPHFFITPYWLEDECALLPEYLAQWHSPHLTLFTNRQSDYWDIRRYLENIVEETV